MEEGSSVTKFRWDGTLLCTICRYKSKADQINTHIETKHYGVIGDKVISLHVLLEPSNVPFKPDKNN